MKPSQTKILNYNKSATLCAVYEKNNIGSSNIYYTHKDYLGSITEITDKDGALLQRINYDAWGNRTLTYNNSVFSDFILDRGYTGHEHLAQFSLINMNGRMYDPALGTMLSPDNFVQNATGTQGFNRYSYAMNNPMLYIDPSGNFVEVVYIVAALILVGKMYYDGYNANDKEANPFKWDWKDATYIVGYSYSGNGSNFNAGIGWGNNYITQVGYNVTSGNAQFGYNYQGVNYMSEIGYEEPQIPQITSFGSSYEYDEKYFHGSQNEANEILNVASKTHNAEGIMFNTSKGWSYEPYKGFASILNSKGEKKWEYRENDRSHSFIYSNLEKQNGRTYISKSIMIDKVQVYSWTHTHPEGWGPSPGDKGNSRFYNIPGYIVPWYGNFGYRFYPNGTVQSWGDINVHVNLPELIVNPKFK
ncbi:MAG: hypothetical protein A2X08_11460 [Bacteroidetes bacterium GWA2_32_17]|nr:MAG: hypothetical protein A2X08_11460 [Bacteroidetes bacterium GWA2_32_17]